MSGTRQSFGKQGSLPLHDNQEFSVFLVDDDPAVLNAWKRFLEIKGYRVREFTSPAEFLNELDPSVAGCAVIDLVLPGLDGLSLQNALACRGDVRPVIFVSGQANLTNAIQAMRAGAVDLLEKPVDAEKLLAAIERAERLDKANRQLAGEREIIRARLGRLTDREREVLSYVIAGRLNKQIAHALGVVEKTIKVHRGRMMSKMGVHTVADLVRMTESVNLRPALNAQ